LIKIVALLSTLFINLYGAIFLFATSNKQLKNRFFLGLFFFNSFVLFVGHFLSFNEYWMAFRYLDFLFLAALLAFYPLYYLYLYSAFNISIFSIKWYLHFLPSIIIAVLMAAATYFSSWENYLMYMNNNLYSTELGNQESKNLAYLYKGTRFFHLLQIVFYNFLTIRFLLLARNKMHNYFSNLDKFQLQYFYIVNISFILLMSIPGFYVTVIGRTPLNNNDSLLFYVCTLFSLLYIILSIIGLRQIPAKINLTSSDLNESTNFHLQELNAIETNLLLFFKDKKPWLDPHLTILEVAKQIGTNRSYISNIINDNIGVNFNQFVNDYRVNEAKILLKQTPELSISEISELAGFGSVSSFLRIFKKIENCTPTEFRKKKH
jgi:AraC-like DNA-binding protein